jgi:hypothetical protein
MADLPPQSQVARLMDGYMTTQLLYIAAKLGIADVLAGGPRTAAEIAEAVGADSAPLGRALRGLVVEDVLSEEGGHFALTPLGECLRDGVPGSLRGPIMVRGDVYYGAAAGLLATVVDGGVAFEHVHGSASSTTSAATRFSRPPSKPRWRAGRRARPTMSSPPTTSRRSVGWWTWAVARACYSGRSSALRRSCAPCSSIARLVVVRARGWLEQQGVGERCECVAGDFFGSVPRGGDAYLLSRVIHDWDDADAHKILATCAAAMTGASRLLLVEAIVPERAKDRPEAVRMDLHMLTLLGARERTEAEFRRLLADAGLTVRGVAPTRSPAGLSVIEATL